MLPSSIPGYHTIVVRTFGYAITAIRIFRYNTYSILKYGAILRKGAQHTSWGRSPSDPLPLEYDLNTDSEIEDGQQLHRDTAPHSPGPLVLPITERRIVHVLAKTPAHPRQSVQYLETAHGATAFLPALRLFLQEHVPQNSIIPGPQDRFDVFRQVVIIAPPDPHIIDLPTQWCIRAMPERHPSPGSRKPGSPSWFDMALISNGAEMLWPCTLEGMLLIFWWQIPGPWRGYYRLASGTSSCHIHSPSSIWAVSAHPCLCWVVHITQSTRPLFWSSSGVTLDLPATQECCCSARRWNRSSVSSYSENGAICGS